MINTQGFTAFISTTAATQTLGLELWRIEIRAANDAFLCGQHELAFQHYEAALEIASQGVSDLLSTQHPTEILPEADRQIAALVVTRHNLADVCRRSAMPEQAVEHLCNVHETLFQLAHHPNLEITALAQRHLKVTYQELIGYTHRCGQHGRIQHCLLLTQYICACCRQKAKH